MIVSIGCQGSTEEGGAQVDGDGGEPDHEQAEGDALRVVRDHLHRVDVRHVIQIWSDSYHRE